MELAKVIGTVVSTIKDPSIQDWKILVIQPLNEKLEAVGEPVAAIDAAQSGPGDIVFWILSREASQVLPKPYGPVDAAIVGHVDNVHVDDKGILDKDEIFVKE
ncbi:EutN/CcmL family microcompartment protein [bacterium]|nr:EutN/CcmL family microcompartment protein [bacterium]